MSDKWTAEEKSSGEMQARCGREYIPVEVGREVEGLEFGAAIAESPESSWSWRKLITAVSELLQLRTVDAGQPQ